eukprot:CAMPEP_0179207722 /NCGR_PEP_ID=MMETSP0796-20121207/103586_1 /TAXON_ID=73915 /ORGANISM="Pyrodinium bahamense, Strain pbaha01" /LENGTH=169 /DNA_ID=CAMNT_0020912661 /DNA_START=794 /DNA_END=1299 /DNA_ORIENTATION=+
MTEKAQLVEGLQNPDEAQSSRELCHPQEAHDTKLRAIHAGHDQEVRQGEQHQEEVKQICIADAAQPIQEEPPLENGNAEDQFQRVNDCEANLDGLKGALSSVPESLCNPKAVTCLCPVPLRLHKHKEGVQANDTVHDEIERPVHELHRPLPECHGLRCRDVSCEELDVP